jgi:tetratricopeptide (TPR) repeat protein
MTLNQILLFPLLATALVASGDVVRQARSLYDRTNYQGSLKLLQTDDHPDAMSYNLLGKNYFQVGNMEKAIEYFEKAASAEPEVADHALWLGRAWGRRAESSNYLVAPEYALRARHYLERAVELSPRSTEALNDLFAYYMGAPGFLGGGIEKAEKVARKTEPLSPAEYHFDLAQIAKKHKDLGSAENELRKALAAAPNEPGRVIDVAQFLAKQRRWEESDTMFRQAEALAPDAPQVIFARARTCIETGRNLPEARMLLQRYLTLPLTPDDPPRTEAERLLRQTNK